MAIQDQNRVKIKYVLSYIDGTTVVPVVINHVNNSIKIDTTHTISFDPETLIWWGPLYEDTPIWLAQSTTTGNAIPLFGNPATGGILVDISS